MKKDPPSVGGRLDPLVLKLGLGLALLGVAALLPGLYFIGLEQYRSAVAQKGQEAEAFARLIADSLEHEMVENDRAQMRSMLGNLSEYPEVRRILILDREGEVKMSSSPGQAGTRLTIDSESCRPCHEGSPPSTESSAIVEQEGGAILRSVRPVRNRQECHACHDPSDRLNGFVITDLDTSRLGAQLRRGAQVVSFALAGLVVVLMIGAALIFRRLVLRPLLRLEATTRAIGAGDLERRVALEGEGALSRLGEEFNRMAASLGEVLSQVRQERAQLERVIDGVEDGVLVIDRDFKVVAVNRSMTRRTTWGEGTLTGVPCEVVWGDAGCGALDCPGRLCFRSGRLETSRRLRREAGGEEREEEIFASPIFGADGKVERVVEVWRDITDRKSQEARIAEMHRFASLGLLASGFSHEVNTPLGTILFSVEEIGRTLARQGAVGAPGANLASQLELIRGEIHRCRTITQQFLALSRGRSIKQDLVEIPVLLEACVRLVNHTAKEAEVRITVEGGEGRPVVLANAGAVQQVLLNILLNAVQASERGGKVFVRWDESPLPSISIRDEGVGIAPAVLSRIFDPFFSLRPTGTGLGLYVSANLVKEWGGSIEVESEPGAGSTFTVTFPSGSE